MEDFWDIMHEFTSLADAVFTRLGKWEQTEQAKQVEVMTTANQLCEQITNLFKGNRPDVVVLALAQTCVGIVHTAERAGAIEKKERGRAVRLQ
jgi:hypothetical protein